MSFIESSNSLRSKMHLSDVSTPALIGFAVCVVVVAVLLIGNIFRLATTDDFQVQEKNTQEEQEPDQTQENAQKSETIKVHVDGCVVNPGVYEIDSTARVQDAVVCAGGLRENADSASINLARQVNDGEQIVIPEKKNGEQSASLGNSPSQNSSSDGAGATSTGTTQGSTSSSKPSSSKSASSTSNGVVNINQADAQELQTLPGVGASTAQKIIDSRAQEGPFISKEDLKRVSGIGEKKFKKLEAHICV